MKSTPLTDKHLALGAKMAEFAGYNMPISYSSITEEHHCVRNNVGVFDVSHMGEFIVKGKEATAFLQSATSNDVSKLQPGDVQYSCLPNKKAGVQTYMLLVIASKVTKDWRWLKRIARGFDVKMQNISAKTGLIAVQGPKAAEALQKLTQIPLAELKYYSFRRGRFA
ncbi:MAG: glycine cleavage system aminomethyltransferase GcvT, partial [Gemmatimonadetes bacterium]|nr:glycine cleavage system aminomethyltransferase GcvT [Gemmatimonadota bacterium]